MRREVLGYSEEYLEVSRRCWLDLTNAEKAYLIGHSDSMRQAMVDLPLILIWLYVHA